MEGSDMKDGATKRGEIKEGEDIGRRERRAR